MVSEEGALEGEGGVLEGASGLKWSSPPKLMLGLAAS
jgi:hypothetical protein